MTMKALASAAAAESRIITPEEADVRMKVGYGIGAVTIAILAIYPPYRTMYGLLGFAVGSAVGVWRSGNQNL